MKVKYILVGMQGLPVRLYVQLKMPNTGVAMSGLNLFNEVSNEPNRYAREIKAEGKKIIGYFCTYAPEEIIHAACLHPLRLFGEHIDINLADKHLQSYCCCLVRRGLSDALSGDLDYIDGIVFPHTCDSIQRLSDIWRMNINTGFFSDVILPVKLNTQSSMQYMIDVLYRFKKDIEDHFFIQITDEALHESIRKYNSIRRSLRKIYEIRSGNPGKIGSKDVYAIVRSSMIMDRDCLAERLSDLTKGLTHRQSSIKAAGKRIMLVGSICSHPDIYTFIEDSGGCVVWDDLCTGTRSFDGMIDEGDDPIVSIAKRYYSRAICPAKHRSPSERGDNIMDIVTRHDIEGVIFLYMKYCDPHAFDYPYLKQCLEGGKIPSILLEVEDNLPSEGQLLTRLETFMHML